MCEAIRRRGTSPTFEASSLRRGTAVPELRKQSKIDDRDMVLVGEQVIICDLSRSEATALMRAFERHTRGSVRVARPGN